MPLQLPLELIRLIFLFLNAEDVEECILDPFFALMPFDPIYREIHTGTTSSAPYSASKRGRVSYIRSSELPKYMKDVRLNIASKSLHFYDLRSVLDIEMSDPNLLGNFKQLACIQTLDFWQLREIVHLNNLKSISYKCGGNFRPTMLPPFLTTLRISDAIFEEPFPNSIQELYITKPRDTRRISFPPKLKKLSLFEVRNEWELIEKIPKSLEKLVIDPLGLPADVRTIDVSSLIHLTTFTSFNRDWDQLKLPYSLTELKLSSRYLHLTELAKFSNLQILSVRCDNLQDLDFSLPRTLQNLSISDTEYYGDVQREPITMKLQLPNNLKSLNLSRYSERRIHLEAELPTSLLKLRYDGMTGDILFPKHLQELHLARVDSHSNIPELRELTVLRLHLPRFDKIDLSKSNVLELTVFGLKSKMDMSLPPRLRKLHLLSVILSKNKPPTSLVEFKSSFGGIENEGLVNAPNLQVLSILNQIGESPTKIKDTSLEYDKSEEADRRLMFMDLNVGVINFAVIPSNMKLVAITGIGVKPVNVPRWDLLKSKFSLLGSDLLVFVRYTNLNGVERYQFSEQREIIDVVVTGSDVVVTRYKEKIAFRV